MAYSKQFREQELKRIFEAILDGDSVSLVGIGTVGKTLLINHFSGNTEVQEHLLKLCNSGYTPDNLLFVRYDGNALLDLRTPGQPPDLPHVWPGFELLLHRLTRSVFNVQSRLARTMPESAQHFADLVARLDSLYRTTQDRASYGPQMIYRYVEEAVASVHAVYRAVFRAGRIVLVFDEFEKLARLMPISFFLNLRALRDQFRYELVFMTAARQPVNELMERAKPGERQEMEPFTELFQHTIYIGPNQTPHDQEEMLNVLVRRKKYEGWSWPAGLKERLLYICGGHSGLTRTCFGSEVIDAVQRAPNHDAAIARLLYEEAVNRECLNILESFTPEEKGLLVQIANGQAIPDDVPTQITVRSLELKHAVGRTQRGSFQVMPPILWHYLARSAKSYPTAPNAPLSVPN